MKLQPLNLLDWNKLQEGSNQIYAPCSRSTYSSIHAHVIGYRSRLFLHNVKEIFMAEWRMQWSRVRMCEKGYMNTQQVWAAFSQSFVSLRILWYFLYELSLAKPIALKIHTHLDWCPFKDPVTHSHVTWRKLFWAIHNDCWSGQT